jgi:hypothetical protein
MRLRACACLHACVPVCADKNGDGSPMFAYRAFDLLSFRPTELSTFSFVETGEIPFGQLVRPANFLFLFRS